jgi:hypothetical protein
MKMWMRRGWVILVVLVLAACSQGPSPAPKAETDYKLWSPEDMLEADPGDALLQAQATQPIDTESFNIVIRYNQNVPVFLQSVVNAAKLRWETVITKDVVGFQGNYEAGSCLDEKAFSGAIDDVQIVIAVRPLDGPGGVLASAGPCLIRPLSSTEAPGIPLISVIIFDTADIYTSKIYDIAFHEMAHTLGHGLIWGAQGLIKNSGTAKPLFAGQNAAREYRRLGGRGLVPLEPRTEQHWDEAVFDNELMTPIINPGTNLLSRLTLASLKDMGYSVNLLAADAYLLPWRP